jgi:hypothetical protein
MNVKIEVIPHDQQRYPTAGDWTFDQNGDLLIRVSKLSDWRREMLVALHELVEVLKCRHDGVAQESVDEFDTAFEKRREEALNGEMPEADKALVAIAEPGDDPKAPYVKQHCLAMGIERIMAAELDVNWHDYETELEALP